MKKYPTIVSILFVLALVILCINKIWLSWNILENFSLGYITSYIFWVMVVWFPEKCRRQILRKNCQAQYRFFRERVVYVLLRAIKEPSDFTPIAPKLFVERQQFKKFFIDTDGRWNTVLSGLQANPELFRDLILEIKILMRMVQWVIVKVEFDDPSVMKYFVDVSHDTLRLQEGSGFSFDQVKCIGNFLLEIMGGFSIAIGDIGEDDFEKMISQI